MDDLTISTKHWREKRVFESYELKFKSIVVARFDSPIF